MKYKHMPLLVNTRVNILQESVYTEIPLNHITACLECYDSVHMQSRNHIQ